MAGDELVFGVPGMEDRYALDDVDVGPMHRVSADGNRTEVTLADLDMRVVRGEQERGVASARLVVHEGVQGFVWHQGFPFLVESHGDCLAVEPAIWYESPGILEAVRGPVSSASTSHFLRDTGSDPCTEDQPCQFWLAKHGDPALCDPDWKEAFRYAVAVGAGVTEAFKQTAVEMAGGGMECPNYEPYGSTTNASRLLDNFHTLWEGCSGCTPPTKIRHLLTGKNLDENIAGLAHCPGQYSLSKGRYGGERGGILKALHEIGHNFYATHAAGESAGCTPRNGGRIAVEGASCYPDRIAHEWEQPHDRSALPEECWSAVSSAWPKVAIFTNGANSLDVCPENNGPALCNNAARIAQEATRKVGG